jgi:hypothetical protein
MIYTFNEDEDYVDEQGVIFEGVVPRDLNVGDRYESYNRSGAIIMYEITKKKTEGDGSIRITSSEVMT